MNHREQLIKDGYMKRISTDRLPPGSWQRDWSLKGNQFYEFVPNPHKVMEAIRKREAAEQSIQTQNIAHEVGEVAVQEATKSELSLVA